MKGLPGRSLRQSMSFSYILRRTAAVPDTPYSAIQYLSEGVPPTVYAGKIRVSAIAPSY